jgi:RNA ligase
MTNISDIMDVQDLVEMTRDGYVRVQTHPVYPYNIACYTKQAMFERVWNDVTMNCRGLIYHQETGEILARPFKKFFNYGEPNAPEFSPDDWVTVYDKVDGSLGIAYDTPDGPAIATKGSFTSDQALHATKLLRTNYPQYQALGEVTDLFEIIYPDNRIVLDYGDLDALWYLGSVWVDDGIDYWNGILMKAWGIPSNHFMLAGEWGMIFKDIPLDRPNREGVVVLNDYTGERLKLKQEDYIELHRVMTGLNERQLWQWLSEGKFTKDILIDLPEELHGWAKPILNRLTQEYLIKMGVVVRAFLESNHMDRKDFALFHSLQPNWVKGALFAKYDGNHGRAEQTVWKQVRP